MTLGKSQRPVLLSAFLLVVIGTFLWFGRSNEETTVAEHPNDKAANQLQWRVGSSQQYDILVNSSFVMTMPGASSGQSMAVKVDGILEFRTLEVSPVEVLVGMRFSSMEMMIAGVSDMAANQSLTQPFRVRIAANGPPRSFEFPAAFAGEQREVIENLVRMFQLTIEHGDAWVVQESNASGSYEAAYTRHSPSTLVKKKMRYIESAAATDPPEVVSEESIRIDVNKDWITAMTIEETVTSNDLSGPSVVVKNYASLNLRARLTAGKAVKWNFVSSLSPAVTSKQAAATRPAISLEEAELKLRASVSALDAAIEGRSIFIHNLRDLLLVDGEMPLILLELMKTQQLSDRTRADLYLVFELAGNPQAQAALTSVLTDQSWSRSDGLRAIVALGGVTSPTKDTLNALWSTAHTTLMGEGRDDLPSTAALALGSIGRGLQSNQDASYSSLRSGLLDGASSATDNHQRAVFLHAIGNTADPDPSLQNNIVPFLNDSVPEVRAAAARTLGRLGTDQVADQLLQSLEHEQNDVVRGSLTEALSSWEAPTLTAIQSVRSVIQDERDENVRYNMALLLGNSMETFPENRKILEQLLAVEQSKRVRQQVAELLYKPR